MGRSGADPLPGHLTGLTPREREVYDWACAEHAAGRYPSQARIGEFLGIRGHGVPSDIRHRIMSKVGWPCPVRNVPSGRHGLTPVQRRILTMAWELWEDGREYPSLAVVASLLGRSVTGNLRIHRQNLVRLGLWPCPIRHRSVAVPPAIVDLAVAGRRAGLTLVAIAEAIHREHRRRMSTASVSQVICRAGLGRSRRAPSVPALMVRKATVLAERNGLAPRKLEDPAAYRRTTRRTHPEN